MSRILAANWKMNLNLAQARALYASCGEARTIYPDLTLLVFPPATALAALCEARGRMGPALGGQSCHSEPKGALAAATTCVSRWART